LKVSFGLLDFMKREDFITDGTIHKEIAF